MARPFPSAHRSGTEHTSADPTTGSIGIASCRHSTTSRSNRATVVARGHACPSWRRPPPGWIVFDNGFIESPRESDSRGSSGCVHCSGHPRSRPRPRGLFPRPTVLRRSSSNVSGTVVSGTRRCPFDRDPDIYGIRALNSRPPCDLWRLPTEARSGCDDPRVSCPAGALIDWRHGARMGTLLPHGARAVTVDENGVDAPAERRSQ